MSVCAIEAVGAIAFEAGVKCAGVSNMVSAMNYDGVLEIRGPSEVLGSEVSLVQNAEGLWNATSMGKYGGREWGQFYRSDKVREYIGELARQLSVSESDVVKYEAHSGKAGGTTWIHKRLALRFLAHQSAKFAVWADGVLERYIDGKITTEESKAAKKAMDALLEDGRIKYERSQKQLQATVTELKDTKGQLGGQTALAKAMLSKYEAADKEAKKLHTELGHNRKTKVQANETKAKYAFVAKLRKAVQAYKRGETVLLTEDFGEDGDGLLMTVPCFVQAMEERHRESDGVGRDWGLFGDTPSVGWNIVPVKRADDVEISLQDFCKHTNFMAAPNHQDKKRVLQDAGDEMYVAPAPKKARRCR